MKNKLFVIFLLMLLVIPIINSAPPWKKQQSTPAAPTQTIIEKTVIINNTTAPQEQKGIDWNMVGGIIAIISIVIAGVGWFLTRKKSSTTSKYMTEINNTFNEYKNNSDQCELHLAELKSKLEKELSSGKLTEQSYDILDRKIENYLSSVRKGIVSQFNLTGDAKNKIDKILKDGKITKEEYESIRKLDLSNLDKNKREKLLKLLKSWED